MKHVEVVDALFVASDCQLNAILLHSTSLMHEKHIRGHIINRVRLINTRVDLCLGAHSKEELARVTQVALAPYRVRDYIY